MRVAIPDRLRWMLMVGAVLLHAFQATAGTVDFEDLSPDTPYTGPGGGFYWNGPAEDGEEQPDPWGGIRQVGWFQSGGVEFANRYSLDFGSWEGFSYSNTTDTATAGYDNQFSAYTGSGFRDSANYGVAGGSLDALDPGDAGQLQRLPWFELPEGASVQSVYVTNTTYAALSMLNGDGFAEKFGGVSGDDPDWFKLTVYGTDASGDPLSETVELFLADYRFSDNQQDYVLDQWTLLDLSSLADAKRMHFNLTSSDVGTWGMNTPAFFAVDDLSFTFSSILQAGDADQDLDFDQFDVIRVSQAAKYLSGEAATWGEGDWDGAPGGSQETPPSGNGLFDQKDIIEALRNGLYNTGPYAAVGSGGQAGELIHTAVPEPSTMVLLGLGLASMLLARQRPGETAEEVGECPRLVLGIVTFVATTNDR